MTLNRFVRGLKTCIILSLINTLDYMTMFFYNFNNMKYVN